jgi:hypothetical protein
MNVLSHGIMYSVWKHDEMIRCAALTVQRNNIEATVKAKCCYTASHTVAATTAVTLPPSH